MKTSIYETTIIINAGLEDAAINTIVDGVVALMERNGAKMQRVDKWGRKRLAYPINKKNNGYYAYFFYEGPGALQPVLERHFFLEENIVRHLSIKLDKAALAHRHEQFSSTGAEAPEAGEVAAESNASAE